jgi:flagellar motor protein MotB
VVIEGFPDDSSLPSSRFPTAEALAFARASAAADVVLGTSRLPSERVQLVGHGGSNAGDAGEESAEERLQRCVRIEVLSLSHLRASHTPTEGR